MKRRNFLHLAGGAIGNALLAPVRYLHADSDGSAPAREVDQEGTSQSGNFGQWTRDQHGLPAYRYTCNQLQDPRAVLPVDKTWRDPRDHIHQVGNDRIVAVASNYGHLQVRQDEGGPKFLNDYNRERNQFGAGIGFLADDAGLLLSTYYTGKAGSFERTFGIGYVRKQVAARQFAVDQVLLAPFGDDPVLLSQVTITNHGKERARLRWVEYWGCHNYQLSYRSLMESGVLGGEPNAVVRRRQFADRFRHRIQLRADGRGLSESQQFLGRSAEEENTWRRTQDSLREKPTGFFGGPTQPLVEGASMDDLAPPPTFLVSLDAPADSFTSHAGRFFSGGIEQPAGLMQPLDMRMDASGAESALLLERHLVLEPGQSSTMYFLYGYLPEGFTEDALVAKYVADPGSVWLRSSAQWKETGLRFRSTSQPWLERESQWNSYYLRSGFTFDTFFKEHIVSQGAGYQYLAGIQCAARDPLQHVLPLIFSDPAIVRGVLRYTLKEMQADGSLPYGIVGHGVPMPCVYRPSDLHLWVLWVATEYVLAMRDRNFLSERVPTYPAGNRGGNDATVLELLKRCFDSLVTTIGNGRHGLLRIFNGDWNDSIVYTHLTPEEQARVMPIGESVLNAAMASFVLDYYAQLLEFANQPDEAARAVQFAQEQRKAVQAQWTGRWYRRAWLTPELGWVGEKQMWLEPQPWALLGNCVPPGEKQQFVATIDELARQPSPIGAILQSQPDPTMKDEPGTGTNAGVFASVNGTLVWALAQVDGTKAWDEWRKNTLAHHAATYPDMWFGIWSGPDAYHSVFAKWPGGTGPDFPVLNMHAHAWPLYGVIKLLNAAFHPRGVRFQPVIPLPEYEVNSPLLGFRKTKGGYAGWYAPAEPGTYSIEITLPHTELRRVKQLRVNGQVHPLHTTSGRVRFEGTSSPESRLSWDLA